MDESSHVLEPYSVDGTIHIGKKCSIANNCTFNGNITIKNGVWMGSFCKVMDGVTIGNGAVISGKSVITKDVPAYAIVLGDPARVIKFKFSKEVIEEIENTKFWDLDISEINKYHIHGDLLKEMKEKCFI